MPATWRQRTAERAGGLARAYDADTAWVLRPMSAALCLFYVGLAALHHVMPGGPVPRGIDVAAAIATLVVGAVAVATWRRAIPEHWSHGVSGVLIGVTTAYAAALTLMTRQPDETGTFVLIAVGVGVGLLRLPWYLVATVAVWAVWLSCVALVGGPISDWLRWAFFLLSATALSAVVLAMRRRSLATAIMAIRRASQAATEDPSTGLSNRRGLALLSREVVALARRHGDAVFCTFLDVDGLKGVNDRYGHDAGDRVILAVAHALRATSRATDVIARWGGDEFVIVGPGSGIPPEQLEARLHDYLMEHHRSDATLTSLQVSAGHALLAPWDDGDVERLLWAADRDMYLRRATRAGLPRRVITLDRPTDPDL